MIYEGNADFFRKPPTIDADVPGATTQVYDDLLGESPASTMVAGPGGRAAKPVLTAVEKEAIRLLKAAGVNLTNLVEGLGLGVAKTAEKAAPTAGKAAKTAPAAEKAAAGAPKVAETAEKVVEEAAPAAETARRSREPFTPRRPEKYVTTKTAKEAGFSPKEEWIQRREEQAKLSRESMRERLAERLANPASREAFSSLDRPVEIWQGRIPKETLVKVGDVVNWEATDVLYDMRTKQAVREGLIAPLSRTEFEAIQAKRLGRKPRERELVGREQRKAVKAGEKDESGYYVVVKLPPEQEAHWEQIRLRKSPAGPTTPPVPGS